MLDLDRISRFILGLQELGYREDRFCAAAESFHCARNIPDHFVASNHVGDY